MDVPSQTSHAEQVLDEVQAVLDRIPTDIEAHQCPGNSPCGHHDVEVLSDEHKPVFCQRFSLGCPHPLTENLQEELPPDILEQCVRLLKNSGLISDAVSTDLILLLGQTRSALWSIDTDRRRIVHFWRDRSDGRRIPLHVRQESLPTLTHELNEKYRPQHQTLVEQRLAIVQRLREIIVTKKHP